MAFFFTSTPLMTLEKRSRLQKLEALEKVDFSTGSASSSAGAVGEMPALTSSKLAPGNAKPPRKERRRRKAEPPATPSTWLQELRSTAMQPLESSGSTQMHREFYFHPRTKDYPLGKLTPACNRGPEAAETRIHPTGIGKRPRVYASYQSDYGAATKDVEDYRELKKMQGSQSEPLIFITELNRRNLNPSMVSEGICGSFVGGTNIALKHTLPASMQREEKRQIGLYEDSYKFWRNNYRPPTHGLGQSECSQFANAMVQQKALLRETPLPK